jgi:hypothetical protein
MSSNSLRAVCCRVLALLTLAAQGCGKGAAKTPADKAEAAVEQFLDAWSRGESPDQFEGSHPTISASDPDWRAGVRLLSFLTEETTPSHDGAAPFRCRVALSLRHPRGKRVDKKVVYEVTLGDKTVVRRAQR